LAATPELAVVVLDLPGGDAENTVQSVTTAAASARLQVEAIVTRQTAGPVLAATTLDVFPLGTCYARNRGAAATGAPLLAFLDSGQIVDESFCRAVVDELQDASAILFAGDAIACRRDDFAAAGGFDHALGQGTVWPGRHELELGDRLAARRSGQRVAHRTAALRPGAEEAVAAGRLGRRRRDPFLAVRAALRGGLAGVLGHSAWQPPAPAPLLPSELRNLEPLAPLASANPAKTHFIYESGSDVLHLHANPSPRLLRSLAEREEIRARARAEGIPALHSVTPGRDSVWVLEARVAGLPPRREQPDEWFAQVVDWVMQMAPSSGAALSASPAWNEHVTAMHDGAPAPLRNAIERAANAVGRLQSVAMHGDLQRQNLCLDGKKVAAVDWEGAWLDGIPGLDLVFLALFAQDDRPAFPLLDRLLEGEDVPWGGIRPALARLGLDPIVLPAALLVMLATWALSEQRRRCRLGSPPPPAAFAQLLAALGPRLADRLG
jgi:hypothetical protein